MLVKHHQNEAFKMKHAKLVMSKITIYHNDGNQQLKKYKNKDNKWNHSSTIFLIQK